MIFIGFIIGFLGYLPPGNINLTVVQVSISPSRSHRWYFIFFASFMEFLYCFGSMMGMKVLLEQKQLITALKWASVVIFLALGLFTLLAKIKDPDNRSSGLRKGIIVAILNPLQIPFWLIWGVYVLQNNWVQPTTISITLFSLITAAGSLTVLWLYSVLGRKLETSLNKHQRLMTIVIGCFFIGLAGIEFIKLVS